MSPASERLLSLYRRAIRLYPRGFRDEYADEMTAVFHLRLEKMGTDRPLQLYKTALRELRDLPPAVVAAYLRERRRKKMNQNLNRWFESSPGSGKELLLAILPFLLIGFLPGLFSLIPAINDLPQLGGLIILGSMALTLIALGVIGLLVELPRWSLSYAGISLTLLSLTGLSGPNNIITKLSISNWPMWPISAVLLGIFLLILLLVTTVVIWAAGHIRLMKPFADRLKEDPTLISYMLYGGSMVILLLGNYDELPGAGVYLMGSTLAMVLGAWGYLRARGPARLWALLAGSTTAPAIALVARLTLQAFPPQAPLRVLGLAIPSEAVFTGLTWLTALVMILAPLVIRPRQAAPPEALAA